MNATEREAYITEQATKSVEDLQVAERNLLEEIARYQLQLN